MRFVRSAQSDDVGITECIKEFDTLMDNDIMHNEISKSIQSDAYTEIEKPIIIIVIITLLVVSYKIFAIYR